jgi:hypothetical protein
LMLLLPLLSGMVLGKLLKILKTCSSVYLCCTGWAGAKGREILGDVGGKAGVEVVDVGAGVADDDDDDVVVVDAVAAVAATDGVATVVGVVVAAVAAVATTDVDVTATDVGVATAGVDVAAEGGVSKRSNPPFEPSSRTTVVYRRVACVWGWQQIVQQWHPGGQVGRE